MESKMATSGSSFDAELGQRIKIVKETLAIVMRSANMAINQNAEVDLGTKSVEGANNRLEKSLEDFYNACDQLQLYLV
ncbi:mediator of RNA polymerase II transcription subunit 29-like [Orbicella faveolata]|uniref:mediator of RNA polymerase II transcription subunit 29-like n=1 Tax=Orbicella faveolata TaxID=48498 RepID=UPI0009E51B42|nr:mediator of RNA polymerase II transcription subunit 29-like [Orbicella faveolata]